MKQKKQIQYFVPSIPVSFSLAMDKGPNDEFAHISSKLTHMPVVPRAGDKLRLLIGSNGYEFIVEDVVYVEDEPISPIYEIDLEEVSFNEKLLVDLNEDQDW